jgi:predicted phage-related endonuclease
MHITGAPRAYLVALIDTHTLVTEVIDRDESIIAELIRRADAFWRLVETDTPPEPDSSDTTRQMLAATHTEPESVIELPDVWEGDLQRREELRELIKQLEDEKTGIENRLRAHMGEHETAVFRGRRVATFKRSPKPRRKVCDDTLDALRDHQPDAYHQIVTETPQPRVLRFTTN